MKSKFWSGTLVALATIGMMIPQGVYAAAPVKKSAFTDIRLNEQGQLVGQVVDGTGAAMTAAKVELKKNGLVASTVQSNKDGAFSMDAVQPGTYQLSVNNRMAHVRVWKGDTAPPAALSQALLLAEDPVRGNYFDGLDVISLFTVGAAITGATVSIINLSETNDISDRLDAIEAATP